MISCRKTKSLTCPEVDDEIKQKDCVWDAVEDDPACAEVVIEEGDGDGEDDEVSDEQDEHEEVPVESEKIECLLVSWRMHVYALIPSRNCG